MTDSKTVTPSEAETFQRCAYIVPRKNRPCKMIVKGLKKFCGEHAVFDESNIHRIPCPINPKHTADKRHLEDHLKKCCARVPEDPWVIQNINKKDIPDEEEKYEDLIKEITKVSKIVEEEYEKIKPEILIEYEEAEIVENDLKKENIGKTKHLKQISSIIGHLMKNKLLENDKSRAVFELGAGRGELAFYMASQAPETKFVLVDYSGIKHKVDNKVKNKNSVVIKRIRCPIEHVDASKISSLISSSFVSAVCKHFCGSATDYGINCIINAISNNVPINGFCLAPCCHHRISISQYIGHDYLKSIKIDTPQLISSLRMIASWATCGPPIKETAFIQADDNGESFKFWSYEKKLILGRKAKAIIEFGRVLYLRKVCGFDCRLLEYIDVNVSPENLMIVGVKK